MPRATGRYAPSPTGDLHVGNAFAAVVTWARARAAGERAHGSQPGLGIAPGLCKLRIEDLDTPRVKPGATQHIHEDLAALGLRFDGDVMVQSQRQDAYEDALAALVDDGLVYGCACSRKDLAASAPHVGDEGPVYPGTCRDKGLGLDDGGDDGTAVALRVRVDRLVQRFGAPVIDDHWQRRFAHDVEAAVGDFIVKRKDGLFAYQLAVVVDDIAQGVTEVVRGQDLLSSAPRQVLLHRALGNERPPSFAHLPLLVDDTGHRLSKRSPHAPELLRTLWGRGVTTPRLLAHFLRLLGVDRGDEAGIDEFAGDDVDAALRVSSIAWRDL